MTGAVTVELPVRMCGFRRRGNIRTRHTVVEGLSFADGATPDPDKKADPNCLSYCFGDEIL